MNGPNPRNSPPGRFRTDPPEAPRAARAGALPGPPRAVPGRRAAFAAPVVRTSAPHSGATLTPFPCAATAPSGAVPAHPLVKRLLIHSSVAGISRRQVLKLCPPLSRMIDEIRVRPVPFTRSMNRSVSR